MRDFKGMKRQRGRNRPGGGGGQGGGKPGNANRAFDSNGPENLKVRGSAQHIFEKYQQLARDATGAGDRVLLENYLQHAEHYYRLIRTLQPQRSPAEIMGRDQVANGYDLDFEDESLEAIQNAAAEAEANGERPVQEEPRPEDGARRDERPYREGGGREFRDRDGPREGRDRDGPREGREFRDGPREGRGDREFRRDRDRPRGDGEGRSEGRFGERPRYGERPREEGAREGQPREDAGRDDLVPLADGREILTAEPDLPGLEVASERTDLGGGDMLRDEEGGLSPAPAFLQAAAPAPAAEGEVRPRRRRRTRAAVSEAGGEDAPASEPDEG